mmetsp:Transcript_860/g.2396  ORF Transcript_860/g.2396 Transcript_860/m.2396 type:complete len:237 (+) Transcript_860:466-1176(+)
MSRPLLAATEPARPINMPSTQASTTTATMRPQGTDGDWLTSSPRGRGPQRRKVPRSVWWCTCRSVRLAATICLSSSDSRPAASICLSFSMSDISSPTVRRNCDALRLSRGSAPRQSRRAESTRKSMPWTSSSRASRSTSSASTSLERAFECACSRAKETRNFARSSRAAPAPGSSASLSAPSPCLSDGSLISSSPSAPRSSAFKLYIRIMATPNPTAAVSTLCQLTSWTLPPSAST